MRVGQIVKHAGSNVESIEGEEGKVPLESRDDAQNHHREDAKLERQRAAQTMELRYFLEMVDHKHRHGARLEEYHDVWRQADTQENFFYWLDQGEGRTIDLPGAPRGRLERQRVRYLSREERLKYLARLDDDGRLSWAKNGQRISTTLEYVDSPDGIIHREDASQSLHDISDLQRPSSSSSISSAGSGSSGKSSAVAGGSQYEAQTQETPIKNPRKLKPWIFVADTSFRLYVGIKRSGRFQHSSFLNGARVCAAGQIWIRDGQIRRMSPLSGHYKPHVSGFRVFVHWLRDAGADLSHVSIARSYAVLIGLEEYVKVKKGVKEDFARARELEERVLHHRETHARQHEKSNGPGTGGTGKEDEAAQTEKKQKKWKTKLSRLFSLRKPNVARESEREAPS